MSDITVEVEGSPSITVEVSPVGATGPQGPVGPEGPAGADGADGAPGAPGTPGAPGADGQDGAPGADGADGASAYDVAVANGFVGDEAAWLASLVGPEGPEGPQGPAGSDGAPGAPGTPGTDGEDGAPGAPGADGADGAPGVGVPTGGTTGQVLAKNSGTDYDTEWIDPPAGGGGSAPEVRHDSDVTYSYMGSAPNGAAEGSSGWTVTRITLTSPPVVQDGTGTWTGRAAIVYS